MKVIYLFTTIALLCMYVASFGQSKVNEDRQTILPRNFQEYERHPIPKARVDAANAPVTEDIPGGSRFTIVDETTLPEYYIVYFWEWTDRSDAQKRNNINFEADGTTIKYFVIPKSELDVVSEKIYRRWSPTAGALTFPFKYRPQNGKFEPTFAIGVTAGITFNPWRLNEHTFSLLGAISASSARVDQFNTDPAANVTEISERTSVTFSLSLVYQWERLQLGIICGIDNILDNELLKWKHQGHGWFSFGVGVGLFSASEIKTPGRNTK